MIPIAVCKLHPAITRFSKQWKLKKRRGRMKLNPWGDDPLHISDSCPMNTARLSFRSINSQETLLLRLNARLGFASALVDHAPANQNRALCAQVELLPINQQRLTRPPDFWAGWLSRSPSLVISITCEPNGSASINLHGASTQHSPDAGSAIR
jgi:hypothetical protein